MLPGGRCESLLVAGTICVDCGVSGDRAFMEDVRRDWEAADSSSMLKEEAAQPPCGVALGVTFGVVAEEAPLCRPALCSDASRGLVLE